MSRAFVKESDEAPEEVADRPISAAPNLVTAKGLAAIETRIAELNSDLSALAANDVEARTRIARDLRYWTARRSSARVVPDPADAVSVAFGSRIEIAREDGRREWYKIVGEDEADPARHTIAYTSPMARAFMGKGVGEAAMVNGVEIEIVSVGQ